MKIASSITVDIGSKTISWFDRPSWSQREAELDVEPRLARVSVGRVDMRYPDDYDLDGKLRAYLEKPRKSLRGKSFAEILLEREEAERGRAIQGSLDQQAPVLDAAMAALDTKWDRKINDSAGRWQGRFSAREQELMQAHFDTHPLAKDQIRRLHEREAYDPGYTQEEIDAAIEEAMVENAW